jgi:hypothetical protein
VIGPATTLIGFSGTQQASNPARLIHVDRHCYMAIWKFSRDSRAGDFT